MLMLLSLPLHQRKKKKKKKSLHSTPTTPKTPTHFLASSKETQRPVIPYFLPCLPMSNAQLHPKTRSSPSPHLCNFFTAAAAVDKTESLHPLQMALSQPACSTTGKKGLEMWPPL